MAQGTLNGKIRKDQTDHYGRVKGSGGGATVDDFTASEDITFSNDPTTDKIQATLTEDVKDILDNALTDEDIKSSEEIIMSVDETDNKIKFNLDNDISNKINNSLQTPLSTPTETELVGIGTDKSQKRITTSGNISVEDNELKVNASVKGVVELGTIYESLFQDDSAEWEKTLSVNEFNNLQDKVSKYIDVWCHIFIWVTESDNIYVPLKVSDTHVVTNLLSFHGVNYNPVSKILCVVGGVLDTQTRVVKGAVHRYILSTNKQDKVTELEQKYNVLQEQYINVLQEINKLKEGGH